eukprot:11177349-Lingulodinium_polyedra.AAC.1
MVHSVAFWGWGPSDGGGPFRTSPRAQSLQAWQGERRASSQTGALPLQAPQYGNSLTSSSSLPSGSAGALSSRNVEHCA